MNIFPLTGASLLLVLLLAGCTSKETKDVIEPNQALGNVLAEETARAAGAHKQVVLILPQWAAASTVGDTLKKALKKQGYSLLFTLSADVGDPMRRGPIGLKSADFFAALEKAGEGAAVVSLAGVPLLSPAEAGRVGPNHPPVLVVATASLGNVSGLSADPVLLARLLETKTIDLAIVDGANPAAQGSGKSDATHQLFAQNYHIVRSSN
jgi:hypothetical protein